MSREFDSAGMIFQMYFEDLPKDAPEGYRQGFQDGWVQLANVILDTLDDPEKHALRKIRETVEFKDVGGDV